MHDIIRYRIKENSWLAAIAARKLKTAAVAMVVGETIHLWGINEAEFEADERLKKHELCHVRQYQQYGTLGFLWRYVGESIRKGYQNNRFEVEARAAETHT